MSGMSLGLKIFLLGLTLVFVGTFVAIIGVAMRTSPTSASYGGFILIGPIPIFIGAGPDSPFTLSLLLILFILILVALAILRPRFQPEV